MPIFTTLRIHNGKITEGVLTQEEAVTLRVPIPEHLYKPYTEAATGQQEPTPREWHEIQAWMQPYLEEWHVCSSKT